MITQGFCGACCHRQIWRWGFGDEEHPPKTRTTGLLHLLFRAWLIASPCHNLLMSSNSLLFPLLSDALSFVVETTCPLSDPWKAYFQVVAFLLFWFFFSFFVVVDLGLFCGHPWRTSKVSFLVWKMPCTGVLGLRCGSIAWPTEEVREDPSSPMKGAETTWCSTEDDNFLCRPLMGLWYGLKEKTISWKTIT